MNEIIALILLLFTILIIHGTVFTLRNPDTCDSVQQIIKALKWAVPLRELVLIVFLFRYLGEAL